MKNMIRKILSFLAIIIFTSASLFASYNSLGVPDSSEIRKSIVETWFEAPLSSVRDNPPELRKNPAGEEFQVRLEEDETTFNIFISPHATINVSVYSDTGVYVKEQDVYPGDAPGSFVLIRDKKTGKPIRARYYFVKNSEVYIQFTPGEKTAYADLVMFGNYAARGVPTGMPFSKFLTCPFSEVQQITETKLPWKYVITDSTLYHSNMQMAAVIREKLPKILYVQDAMYDEDNNLVHISTGKTYETYESDKDKTLLSSAGFVKWIADGLVEPLTGGMLKRKPLIIETVNVKDVGYQGILSQKYNLFFSLDWIRNLASGVVSVYMNKNYMFNESGVDVTINPFASSITEKGVANTVTFVDNSGYNVAVLQSLLYVLAATEPGTFYFGAIRGTDRSVSPEVKAFNECVVFFPYFLSDGAFGCSVFMNGRELTLEDFYLLYEGDFVYLTRVKSSEQFFPN